MAGSFVVKRVVRSGGGFVCGICHRRHEQREEAESCLEGCLAGYFEMNPIVPVPGTSGGRVRCLFCGREYGDPSLAHHCAEGCKAKFLGARHAERGVALPLKARRSVVSRSMVMMKMGMHSPANNAARGVAAAEEVSRNVPEPEIVKSAPSAPVAEAPAEGEAEAAPQKKKDRNAPTHIRNGAKYVCTVCNKEYFTKVEVTQCWESHP